MDSQVNHNGVLKADNLSIGYQQKKHTTVIADQLNFELFPGTLVGLIGGNGIGKSTLIKTLTGTLPKLDGTILLNNQNAASLDAIHLAQQLSVVLTENVSNTNLSVWEVIALGRQPYTNWIGQLTENDRAKIQQAIDMVKINDLIHKKCYELSDGQYQKVMLARALAQDTSLIILDEPTTHLDLYHKVYILKLLQQLAKETNKTILFSTHEINVALSLCDQLIVMKEGKTSFGTPNDLIKNQELDDLFPEDLVQFDHEKNAFIIK